MSSNTSITYGTISSNGYGISLTPSSTEKPASTPAGLIVTRAVEVQAGWVGQLLVDKAIIKETAPQEEAADALQDINQHLVTKLTELLA